MLEGAQFAVQPISELQLDLEEQRGFVDLAYTAVSERRVLRPVVAYADLQAVPRAG